MQSNVKLEEWEKNHHYWECLLLRAYNLKESKQRKKFGVYSF